MIFIKEIFDLFDKSLFKEVTTTTNTSRTIRKELSTIETSIIRHPNNRSIVQEQQASLLVLLIPHRSFVILTQEVIKAINWGTAPGLLSSLRVTC